MRRVAPAVLVLVALACVILWQRRPVRVIASPQDAGLADAIRSTPRFAFPAAGGHRLRTGPGTAVAPVAAEGAPVSPPAAAGAPASPPAAVGAPAQPPAALAAAEAQIDAAWLDRERTRFLRPRPAARNDVAPRNRLLLANRTAAPAVDGPSAPDPAALPSPRGTLPFVVQVDGADLPARRAELEAAGAAVRGYIPNRAWLVEAGAL
ncbi:MAG: hypothetical protein FJ221_17615, partial [Lentisphaerae bacterium]|nr:hypothetical protein [Lentisphaerota bacterium]